MKRTGTILAALVMLAMVAAPAFAQQVGDYRSKANGDWNRAQNWERFNGSVWGPIGTAPTGSETITVRSADSIFVNVDVTITGRLINEGIVETDDQLTIGDGGVYEHARDEGKIDDINWAEGSTLLMTGVTATAPSNRDQDYHNITFNTEGQLSNLNMGLDDNTISGDIRVINSGFGRWYLTSASANDTSIVTIMGDMIVEGGAFSVHGTSNANTTFIVHHHGDIDVTGGNFSISRGSQGLGTTTWNLYDGNFSMSNATTQSSTITPGGARFVFSKEGTQTLALGEGNTISALPIEVKSGTTLDMGSSALSGSGNFWLNEGGMIATSLPGGISEIFSGVVAEVVLEDNAGFEFNGTAAQVTSSRMPTVVSDLTIDNPEGVKLSQETTINGVLRLVSGVFDNTIPFELGPNGSISYEGGSLLVASSSESANELPESFFVEQNFPNPFNLSTVIRFGLPSASEVSVRVFNMLGQEVGTLFEGRKNAGVHEVTFDAAGLSSGIYIYRVESANMTVSKRMVLIE